MKKLIFIAITILVVAGAIWYFTGSKDGGTIKVLKTDTITRGNVSKVLEATGIIKAQVGAQVKIGARATGVLTNVVVKVGDPVSKGDLIAEIDSRELRARIDEARADLRRQQAELDYMEKNLPRQKSLVRQQLAAQDTLDQAYQDADMARHAVASSRARLETLNVQLSYTKIFSPIDGVVSQVAAQEGETIVSGLSVSNLITVLDPTRLEMWIYIDETDIGRLTTGLPVEYTVDAYRDKIFEGTVDRVYPEPEIRDNIVYYRTLVRVTKEQSDWLRPEMTTQCKIIVETKKDVLTVPNTALKWVANRQVCFVVDNPEAEPREVSPKLGLVGLERSEVTDGLKEGDTVATQLVLPGVKVKKKGNNMSAAIQLDGITKTFFQQADKKNGKRKDNGTPKGIEVLKGITLDINQGEFVALQGTSGSGKSTLLHIIGLLDRPTDGIYTLLGNNTAKLDDDHQSDLRNLSLGFVFQSFYLIPYATALENVILPGLYSGKPRTELHQRAEFLLEQVGLSDRMDFNPSRLSGGQQQRVAMARALLNEPKIILADEPTGQLDSNTSTEIMKLFHRVHDNGQTIVLVTHDEDVAKEASRIIKLHDGRIVEDVPGGKTVSE